MRPPSAVLPHYDLSVLWSFLIASIFRAIPLHLTLGLRACLPSCALSSHNQGKGALKCQGCAAELEKLDLQEAAAGRNRLYRKGHWHEDVEMYVTSTTAGRGPVSCVHRWADSDEVSLPPGKAPRHRISKGR